MRCIMKVLKFEIPDKRKAELEHLSFIRYAVKRGYLDTSCKVVQSILAKMKGVKSIERNYIDQDDATILIRWETRRKKLNHDLDF